MTLAASQGARARTAYELIDCDVHNPIGEDDLFPRLPGALRRRVETYGLREPAGAVYPRFVPGRQDLHRPADQSKVDFLRETLLDEWGVSAAILNPLTPAGLQLDLELDAALARAANDCQAADWLDHDDRLRASIVIPYEAPDLAVEEIERRAGDRRFVQVQLLGRPHEPMGRRKYWPIYEACARHGLVVMSHAFYANGNPTTGAGWPSFYIEDHVGPAQAMQANLISLVFEGVFERFPGLRVISAENGLAWAASLMWRLDAAWELMRDEVPHLTRPPSAYIREHVWFCTQPMEEPHRPEYFLQMIEQIGAPEQIVFASDYPHWDWDAPDQAFPVRLPDDLERRIRAENARALYGLGR
jgi:predicted TIM-barrel fold metal-dependent hydrolase